MDDAASPQAELSSIATALDELSRRVTAIAESSGSHVVLAAAECLPPGSVERIVLLAPSVASGYDLRRAIRATNSGIDVYYSPVDQVLDLAVNSVGTADRVFVGVY